MHTFSVIIATHNRPQLLRRALQSLHDQSYGCHQIIVVSDVQNAETDAVAQALLRPGDCYVQRNGVPGPSESRNLALKLVTGDYFFFLDDDDSFAPGFLQSCAQALVNIPVPESLFFTNFEVVNESVTGDSISTIDGQAIDLNGQDASRAYVKNFIPNNCLAFPRSLATEIQFDLGMAYEDWDFTLAAMDRRPARHLPVWGPRIHKNVQAEAEQRGKKNDDKLLDTYVQIYRRHPAPTAQVQTARKELFASIQLDFDQLVGSAVATAVKAQSAAPAPASATYASRGLDALGSSVIFVLWLGPYVMSEQRTAALHSIVRDAGCPVCFITDATLPQWEVPGSPFHPALRHLSQVHQVDYMRCYLMHHYGGGYTDIKAVLQPWQPIFQSLRDSDALALGYPEISADAVAQLPGELGQQLREHFADVIGYCSMLFKPQTALTTEWFNATHRLLDGLHAMLQEHPAQHPMDQLGVILPDGKVSRYPLRWTELGGNIFHPVILKHHARVTKDARIMPQLHSYR